VCLGFKKDGFRTPSITGGNPNNQETQMHTQEWRQRQRERREEMTGDYLTYRDQAIDEWLASVAAERDCASDCPEQPNEELVGLTIRTLEDLEEDQERDAVEEAIWRYYH
jgi:hypothetical protein